MNATPNAGKDPGLKKNDGYSKQVSPEKIVNEQDQNKVSNNQANPQTKEPGEDNPKPEVSDNIEALDNNNTELSDKATEEAEHVTQETLEEDRKHQAGINA